MKWAHVNESRTRRAQLHLQEYFVVTTLLEVHTHPTSELARCVRESMDEWEQELGPPGLPALRAHGIPKTSWLGRRLALAFNWEWDRDRRRREHL